jgi:hypothetical protein
MTLDDLINFWLCAAATAASIAAGWGTAEAAKWCVMRVRRFRLRRRFRKAMRNAKCGPPIVLDDRRYFR